jgi:hypothetical protein
LVHVSPSIARQIYNTWLRIQSTYLPKLNIPNNFVVLIGRQSLKPSQAKLNGHLIKKEQKQSGASAAPYYNKALPFN